jgi:hypothetical protein
MGYPKQAIFDLWILPREKKMAKVAPYHTKSQEYPPSHRNVYHDHDDCHDGKAIKKMDREPGTAGRPRCKVCIDLG